jgi:hypothetical protein
MTGNLVATEMRDSHDGSYKITHVTPCSMVDVYRLLGETFYRHLKLEAEFPQSVGNHLAQWFSTCGTRTPWGYAVRALGVRRESSKVARSSNKVA